MPGKKKSRNKVRKNILPKSALKRSIVQGNKKEKGIVAKSKPPPPLTVIQSIANGTAEVFALRSASKQISASLKDIYYFCCSIAQTYVRMCPNMFDRTNPNSNYLGPNELAFWCYGIVLYWVKKHGIMAGSSFYQIPDMPPASRIPLALAYLLEALAPALDGGIVNITIITLDSSPIISDLCINNSQFWDYPYTVGMYYSDTSSGGELKFIPSFAQVPIALADFMSERGCFVQNMITQCEGVLVPFSGVPTKASDFGAYVSLPLGEEASTARNWQAYSCNYDNTTALLFSSFRDNLLTDQLNNRVVLGPTNAYQGIELTPSDQYSLIPKLVFCHICFDGACFVDKDLTFTGSLSSRLNFNGSKLDTLWYVQRPIDVVSYENLIATAYGQIRQIMNKALAAAAQDPDWSYLWAFYTMNMQMLLCKLNLVDPLMASLTLLSGVEGDPGSLYFQHYFASRMWLGLSTAAPLARYLSGVAPVVRCGRMYVPSLCSPVSSGNVPATAGTFNSTIWNLLQSNGMQLPFPGAQSLPFASPFVLILPGVVQAPSVPLTYATFNAAFVTVYKAATGYWIWGPHNSMSSISTFLINWVQFNSVDGNDIFVHVHIPTFGHLSWLHAITISTQVITLLPRNGLDTNTAQWYSNQYFFQDVGGATQLDNISLVEALIHLYVTVVSSTLGTEPSASDQSGLCLNLPVIRSGLSLRQDIVAATVQSGGSFQDAIGKRRADYSGIVCTIGGLNVTLNADDDYCWFSNLWKSVVNTVGAPINSAIKSGANFLCHEIPGVGALTGNACGNIVGAIEGGLGTIMGVTADGVANNTKAIDMSPEQKATAAKQIITDQHQNGGMIQPSTPASTGTEHQSVLTRAANFLGQQAKTVLSNTVRQTFQQPSRGRRRSSSVSFARQPVSSSRSRSRSRSSSVSRVPARRSYTPPSRAPARRGAPSYRQSRPRGRYY